MLCLVLAGCAASPPAATLAPLAPTAGPAVDRPDDAFYEPPPIRAGLPLGSILRVQPLVVPDGVRAWAILYSSTGLDGSPIAVSGIVAVPDGEPPAGGRPVVAYAHGTTGLADACAPSRAGTLDELKTVAAPFLEAGAVVVGTDYEGLGTPGPHPYMVGPSEGRAVLDSIRAAHLLPGAGASVEAGIIGFSQGGHAALWAAELAPSYAPELDIRGVVAAAPGGDLAAIVGWLSGPDGTPDAWGNALLLASAWHEVFELPLEGVLSADNRSLAAALQTACDVAGPSAQPLLMDAGSLPGWREQLEANTPGGARASAPILVLHGTKDEQIPLGSTRSAVQRLCAAGDSVEFRVIEGANHGEALFEPAQLTGAVDWLSDRLGGRPAAPGCAT